MGTRAKQAELLDEFSGQGLPEGFELSQDLKQSASSIRDNLTESDAVDYITGRVMQHILRGTSPVVIAQHYNIPVSVVRKLEKQYYQNLVNQVNPIRATELIGKSLATYQYVSQEALKNYDENRDSKKLTSKMQTLTTAMDAQDRIVNLVTKSGVTFGVVEDEDSRENQLMEAMISIVETIDAELHE